MRRPIPALAVVALLLAGCGGAASGGGAATVPGSPGTAATAPTGTGAETAVLGIIEPGVDVADEAPSLDAARFRVGEDGEGLVVSDLVRTDDVGYAEVRWFDGALARVDVDSVLLVTELDVEADAPEVRTRLDVGRVWNRLDVDTGVSYEVTTDVGTAAVRGTAFLVECLAVGCRFAVAEGIVLVRTASGTDVELRAGEQVRVDDDGRPGAIEPFDPDDDPWIADNLDRDEDGGFGALAPAGPQDPEPSLATASLDGTYDFAFVRTESNFPANVGVPEPRTWRFDPSCATGPCAGGFDPGDGEEPLQWDGEAWTASWVDRPAGECPDGSPQWGETLTLTFRPLAFDVVAGRTVVTEVDATWDTVLTPTAAAVASGCDTVGVFDEVLEGVGTRSAT